MHEIKDGGIIIITITKESVQFFPSFEKLFRFKKKIKKKKKDRWLVDPVFEA